MAKVKMRPFSLGTLNFCRQMGLTMFTGAIDGPAPEGTVELPPDMQLSAFSWLQAAPLNEVLAAVRGKNWQPLVEEFAFNLEFSGQASILAEVERIAELAEAAAVDVAKKPGESQEKGAPPKS